MSRVKKNALTVAMYQAMADALRAAAADGAVRAVLITGQPSIFTSGNDIEDFMARPPGAGGSATEEAPVFQFMKALLEIDKPVVAAVTGAAIGIGTTMLLHCDFVYVADDARLAMPFVGLGLVPEYASSLLVPQLMGPRRAAEKLLLGDPFTGEQAVECGIANAVLPASEVALHARRVAERFNAPTLKTRQFMRCGPLPPRVTRLIGVNPGQFGMVLTVSGMSYREAPITWQRVFIPPSDRDLELSCLMQIDVVG